MDNITDLLANQMLSSLDSSEINPTREQKYLAFLVCKNLTDLGETGLSIINSMLSKGVPVDGLPEPSTIGICQTIIQKFYSDDMFIPDEEGFSPNWSAVNRFNKTKTESSYRIYRAIRNNVVETPKAKDIQKAITDRNKDFFLKNFDSIFADVPFKDGLIEFKNFLKSPYVSSEHQDIVWDFFDVLLDLFLEEEEILEDLKDM